MGPQGGGDLVLPMLGCVCLKVKEMGPFLAKIMRKCHLLLQSISALLFIWHSLMLIVHLYIIIYLILLVDSHPF